MTCPRLQRKLEAELPEAWPSVPWGRPLLPGLALGWRPGLEVDPLNLPSCRPPVFFPQQTNDSPLQGKVDETGSALPPEGDPGICCPTAGLQRKILSPKQAPPANKVANKQK